MSGEGKAPSSALLRLANLDFLPFLVAEFERAGVAWSVERQPGFAAHVEAKTEGDPEKFAAVRTACDAVLAAIRAMDPDPAPDGDDGDFTLRVARALGSKVVRDEMRRQILADAHRNPGIVR